MTTEQHLKQIIGDLAFQLAMAQAKIEELAAQLETKK